MSYRKRTAALASAAALAGSAVLMAAPAAHAEVVDVNYQCKTPIGDKSAVSPIDIKGAMSPSATIKLGGADSGTMTVTGPANQEAIPANTPIKINDLTGTYTPKKSGKVTLTAGVLTIKALGTTTTCTPSNNPGPSLTLDVTAGSGAGAGGGNQSGTDSGAALPQTGPEDSAIALGTLGGTVLLAGAAGALWLTRRHQTVRR